MLFAPNFLNGFLPRTDPTCASKQASTLVVGNPVLYPEGEMEEAGRHGMTHIFQALFYYQTIHIDSDPKGVLSHEFSGVAGTASLPRRSFRSRRTSHRRLQQHNAIRSCGGGGRELEWRPAVTGDIIPNPCDPMRAWPCSQWTTWRCGPSGESIGRFDVESLGVFGTVGHPTFLDDLEQEITSWSDRRIT